MYRLNSRVLAGFILLTASTHSAIAIQVLTQDAALKIATETSPIIQKFEAQKNEAIWKKSEGASVFLPTVSLSANHFVEKKYQLLDISFGGGPTTQIPQIYPTSSAGLSAKWILFDGFSNVNTFRAANRIKDAGEKDYEWAKFQLEREVSLAYAKVIAAKKLQAVADENLKTLENHMNQVKELKAGGVATHYDVLRVEAQLSEAAAELMLTNDNIEIAQGKLGQSLGLEESVDASAIELATPNSEKIKNADFKRNENKRLDLEASAIRVEASDLIDSANNRFWIPKFGMMADYIKYNNQTDPISDWNRYRTAYDLGFFISWDLFNPRLFSQSKGESYKLIQNQKSLISANLQAPIDFAFWKKRYLYSTSLYQAKRADLDRATETVRLAQAGFKAGVRTTTEVLDAELDLFRARAGIVNTQMNAEEAKVKMELALGEAL